MCAKVFWGYFPGPRWRRQSIELLSFEKFTHPLAPKLLVVGMLVYIIQPTDLMPDFLVGIGQLDDLAIFPYGRKTVLSSVPR